jgi:hypothetical protein
MQTSFTTETKENVVRKITDIWTNPPLLRKT